MRFTPALFASQQFIGPILHPRGHVSVGRSAVGRVVFEAAVLRRIVRRRDDDPVGQVLLCARGYSTRIACEMTGVGVTPSSRWMNVSTPLAARTSSAVRCAGPESACVSLPMYSGPSMLWLRR